MQAKYKRVDAARDSSYLEPTVISATGTYSGRLWRIDNVVFYDSWFTDHSRKDCCAGTLRWHKQWGMEREREREREREKREERKKDGESIEN